MKKSNRVQYIDVARGIAIILMIVGHALNPGLARNIIFSFHMPLFIVLSGFFYKDRSFKEEFKTLFFKLFIPTAIAIFILCMIQDVPHLGFYKSYIEALKSIAIGWSYQARIQFSSIRIYELWFVYSLITVRLLFFINKKIVKDNELLLFFIILLETYLGFILGIKGYYLAWSFDISLACMLFYYVGYLLNKYKLLDRILSDYWLLIILLALWIAGFYNTPIELAIRRYNWGLFSYLIAISGSLIVLKLSQLIDKYSEYISYFFSWCGKNSLYVLIGHYFEMNLVGYKSIKNVYLLMYLKVCISFAICFVILGIKKLIDIVKKHE